MTVLTGPARAAAIALVRRNHYTRSVPSGKTHVIAAHGAVVLWSIPANRNIAQFILWKGAAVWELSRLWAPDGHARNTLSQAISVAVRDLESLEAVDAVVSYADPNAGHSGTVYKAASWAFDGQSEESRLYRGPDGVLVARRAFHSGSRGMRRSEIEALGYTQQKAPGKLRFVRGLTRKARKVLLARHND